MSAKFCHMLVVLALLIVAHPALADEAKPPKFPFPVEIDKSKGKTGDYPNRIRDRRFGIWYVYVPGGKYQIGSNERSDSRSIEVTLSGFYISEKRVSCAQIAEIFKEEFTPIDLANGMKQFLFLKDSKGWAAEETADTVRGAAVGDIFLRGGGWLPMWTTRWMPISSGLSERAGKFIESIDATSAGDKKRPAKERVPVFKLTPKQREEAEQIVAAFNKELAAFRARGDAAYEKVTFGQAADCASKCGVSLPTEAQWEAAARLHAAKRIQLDGMLDKFVEWCSDYYAFDYFHRKDDFRDPKGPPRGRLTDEQLRHLGGSSFGISNRRNARRCIVFKGLAPENRFYGYNDCPFTTTSTIRLVFNPE